jgi:hypothetical protein
VLAVQGHGPAGIVHHNGCDEQLMTQHGVELLEMESHSLVAGDEYDTVIRSGDLGTDGHTLPDSEPTHGAQPKSATRTARACERGHPGSDFAAVAYMLRHSNDS